MRVGVLLCTTPSDKENNLAQELAAKLQRKDISVLLCDEKSVTKKPEGVVEFITSNNLQRLVISSSSKPETVQALQASTENAGLRRGATSYVDFNLLSREPTGSLDDLAAKIVSVNLARMEHADYIDQAVYRTVQGPTKVSRRELFGSLPKVLKVESEIPIVIRDRCMGRSKSCDYCRKACPVQAVSEFGDTVVISDRLCIECGACARECPIGAIQVPSISDAQMLAMLNALASEESRMQERALMVTCPIGFDKLLDESKADKRLSDGIVPVQIPCVASIGSVQQLWAASLGITLVTVCPDAACKKAAATMPIREHLLSSRTVLENLADTQTSIIEHLSLNHSESVVDSVSRAVTPLPSSARRDTLSQGSRREVTLGAISRLQGAAQRELMLPLSSRIPLYDLRVEEDRCTFCEYCQRVCPDHAIEFGKSEGSVRLMFDPASCGGCMICVTNCPEHAISMSALTSFASTLAREKIEKVSDEYAKCEHCGTALGTKRSLDILKRRLSEKGMPEMALKALNLCNKCKQMTAFYARIGEYSIPPEAVPSAVFNPPHLQQKQKQVE